MNRHQHPSNNHVLGAPSGFEIESCKSLPVTVLSFKDGSTVIRSYWMPTEREKQLIALGLPVILDVMGTGMPPVKLQVE